MPDYKYASSEAAKKYSACIDYPEAAANAVKEMFSQVGPYVMDENGILKSGLLIRHLILPGEDNISNSMDVIDFIADNFEYGSVLFSLMSQFTPMPASSSFPELRQRVSRDANNMLIHYMKTRHLSDGYYQDVSSATSDLIPSFDGTGL